MANWLERARREILAVPAQPTAVTAESAATAVTAVPQTATPDVLRACNGSNGSNPQEALVDAAAAAAPPMTDDEVRIIRAWLVRIGESDPQQIEQLLTACQHKPDARRYALYRATEVCGDAWEPDDRRHCTQCRNLTERGLCLAARRGELIASRDYQPVRKQLRRCEAYQPGPNDLDHRTGRQRWPGLVRHEGS